MATSKRRSVDISAWDLTEPSTFLRPELHDFWKEVRRELPIYWHPDNNTVRPGFWVVSRYDDVVRCYRDASRLGSSRGTVLDVLLRGDDSAGGRMLPVTDGEWHRKLRKLMRSALTMPLMKAAGELAAQQLEDTIGKLCDGRVFDFASEVSEKVPISITCSLLGIPASDVPWLLSCSTRALSSEIPSTEWIDALEARNEILIYLGDLARLRRQAPGRDVVSAIATATIDGERLPLDDVALNCYSLILGGDESSRVSSISAVQVFADRPDIWKQVRTGAVDLDSTVEEILRWATPAQHFARTATESFPLRGQEIIEGDIVTLWNISANYDEAQFDRPREFLPTRSPNRHVSLGVGPHFCLGAWLGRAELKAFLIALTTHVTAMEIVGDIRPIHSTFLRGAASLPVRFNGVN